ncbi:BaiN/RdsA family NAD(P)/FAD-dependent oxidoreductase [Litoreibacter arenae]|uniref:NAD(FAD)-utilizing dehydrogenase n=1 Tax=Litoreibacter arenae DSM 19593 TaxID=1123360 RepID=S9RTC0_9RHOB|nr:NAD(P)/FAD-dependent oxidoreductase [Litoreibacter arenae]EPX77184.1 NAD(FAD)-utilizing dehydrogenase [Litoreibacter arenae DSM 19593]
MEAEVVIIGAGAAGMMCAIEAARRGRSVVVLDHAKAPGEKIRISGGGRCNFTNLDIQPDRFLSQNPRFALSALKRFTQWDFIAMIDAAGIPWHEKTLGQLFCDRSAKDVIAMLLGHMQDSGARLKLDTTVTAITRQNARFRLESSGGVIHCDSLVIASGGKSIPKMGATGFGYRIAEQFDLPLIETRPALVPLTFAEQDLEQTRPLSGTSVQASVACNGARFAEGLLFTHRGLSGPSVLQISSYWKEGDLLEVDLAAGADVSADLKAMRAEAGRMSIKNALARIVPEKLAAVVVAETGLTGNLADQNNAALERLASRVHAWQIKPVGSEGYRTAEVTLGGVDTDALDARTMEAKDVPGLYFIGEVVDVTGWLGGYNFQWAWSSGWAAGQVV